jgi:hypothetical protein
MKKVYIFNCITNYNAVNVSFMVRLDISVNTLLNNRQCDSFRNRLRNNIWNSIGRHIKTLKD